MIVNDASTIKLPEIKIPKNIKKIEIFNMKKIGDMLDVMLLL